MTADEVIEILSQVPGDTEVTAETEGGSFVQIARATVHPFQVTIELG